MNSFLDPQAQAQLKETVDRLIWREIHSGRFGGFMSADSVEGLSEWLVERHGIPLAHAKLAVQRLALDAILRWFHLLD